jgi:ABC-type oligopeptide transport system substrate-binding subunit
VHGYSNVALQAAALVKYDLQQMGCGKIVDVGYCGFCRYIPAGPQPVPRVDIRSAGWVDDYPDAYDFLHFLLDGRNIAYSNNNDLAFFNNKTFNARLDQANKLSGIARNQAFGRLDQWVMTKYAPLAPIATSNFVDYLSPNAHGYVFNGPFGSVDLGDLYQS